MLDTDFIFTVVGWRMTEYNLTNGLVHSIYKKKKKVEISKM